MYTVYVSDNYHYMSDDETYKHGEFETWEQAEEAARAIVDQCLNDYFQPGISAEQLYKQYSSFGDDPYITPQKSGKSFSAWEYAQQRSRELSKTQ